jgi:hypothetical protein
MIQYLEDILPMLKEREIADFKSKEIKRLIRENNQETDGVERQAIAFCTVLVGGDAEEADHDKKGT